MGPKKIPFKTIQFSKFNENHKIELNVLKDEAKISLINLVEHFYPSLKDESSEIKGNLKLDGFLHLSDNKKRIQAQLIGKSISASKDGYAVKGLNLKHSIVNLDTFQSEPNQSLSIDEFNAGIKVKNIELNYQVLNKNKLKVDLLGMEYDGAVFIAKNFEVHPEEMTTGPVLIKIKNLDLGKFLKLALGESAVASGQLDGHIKINFLGKKPIIESGQLFATEKGKIVYRPATSTGPPKQGEFDTDPMAILYSYLYDFQYKTLKVDVTSDKDYNMLMTLHALGQNPSYLNGKPLKLRVNLEQNLLAAFKALMLSYQLPQNLQDKISKMGNL